MMNPIPYTLVLSMMIPVMALSQGKPNDDRAESRQRAIEQIDKALSQANDPQSAALTQTAKELIDWLSFNPLAVETLQAALKAQGPRADRLIEALRDVKTTLTFEPLMEAELPKGFPEPTPVGEVHLKEYPAYRMAKADMQGENRAFWQLFSHIKENSIAMTAPVEMTYRKKDDELNQSSMAFLYGSRDLGKLGKAGEVEVMDISPMKAISVGIRGEMTKAKREQAQRWLEAWLEEHRDEYHRAGPLRVMGYNSPFVPREKKYSEVQIPVKAAKQ